MVCAWIVDLSFIHFQYTKFPIKSRIRSTLFGANSAVLSLMQLKANLHFHTSDDPEDAIDYTTREGIDRAAELGFRVLAVTCHRIVAWRPEDAAYARMRGILLIAGVECEIEGHHVVLLNTNRSAESVSTFTELAAFRRANPEAFVFAPHPYFGSGFSLGRQLETHRELFDAVELSWFHATLLDRNRKAERFAHAHGLPYLATSDTHLLPHLDDSYALIFATELTAEAVFAAIRAHNFTNVSRTQRFWKTMVLEIGVREIMFHLKWFLDKFRTPER
jgi:predicted metal-dependent phosphoesterase TrpH